MHVGPCAGSGRLAGGLNADRHGQKLIEKTLRAEVSSSHPRKPCRRLRPVRWGCRGCGHGAGGRAMKFCHTARARRSSRRGAVGARGQILDQGVVVGIDGRIREQAGRSIAYVDFQGAIGQYRVRRRRPASSRTSLSGSGATRPASGRRGSSRTARRYRRPALCSRPLGPYRAAWCSLRACR